MFWPFAAAKVAIDACGWWLDREWGSLEPRSEPALPWTSANKVRLELASLRLRDFSRASTGVPALICAPYALHSPLIADFAPGHSIIETLGRCGQQRLYLTDWRSASQHMRFLGIDHYLSELNVAVDDIGAPVDLIGLCQGGWLSLVYAARFPDKVRRLVLVGAPVDVSVGSDLSRAVASTSESVFKGLVGSGGGVVIGDHLLPLWSRSPDLAQVLQRTLSSDSEADCEITERFRRWYSETLNLPGTYYLQVVNWIFRENRLANGSFVALGRALDLGRLKTPLFLLVGTEDEVVPADQGMATASLVGTPVTSVESLSADSTHLGLFLGSRTLALYWPRIARWLQEETPGIRSRELASV